LESKIAQLEEEVEKLKSLFQIVDEIIVTRSFQKAEIVHASKSQPVEFQRSTPPGEEVPLKTSDGLILAKLYFTENEARIIPADNMIFTIGTPPFQAFFLRRILESMQAKDQEDAKAGLISHDQVLSYDVLTDGEIIKEVIIRNYGNQRRLREILTSSRWTLEKMYEKVKPAT
jgi:hypothetical protein